MAEQDLQSQTPPVFLVPQEQPPQVSVSHSVPQPTQVPTVTQVPIVTNGLMNILVVAPVVGEPVCKRLLTLFQEKYLGDAILSSKISEFINLKQGTMSVADYTAKFEELAQFAPTMVPNDSARKMKFIHGL